MITRLRGVGIYIGYNEQLAHLIEAGGRHLFNAVKIRAVRAKPNVFIEIRDRADRPGSRWTDDTVQNWDAVSGTGNGFKFGLYRADKLLEKIYEARFAYAGQRIMVKDPAKRYDGR